ncbi:MAG: hypothetical protein VX561_03310 [Pseudomonadota bacterium]|nr:hypothetical protein [Pseudomonadota bacterium]
MSRPDLNTEEGRAAYRRELRRVAWPIRWGGLGLIVLAAVVILAARQNLFGMGEAAVTVAYGLLAAGWALWVAAVFIRTRHHKRRLAEGL